jgi:hypothetical protein
MRTSLQMMTLLNVSVEKPSFEVRKSIVPGIRCQATRAVHQASAAAHRRTASVEPREDLYNRPVDGASGRVAYLTEEGVSIRL